MKHKSQNKKNLNSDQQINEQQASTLESVSESNASNDDVQRLAYKIHEEKGGSDFDNWIAAEQLLNSTH